MGYKILSYFSLALSFLVSVALAIATFVFTTEQGVGNIIFIFLASLGIFLLALRFNIVAIRHDSAERMVLQNVGLIIVSLYLTYIFIAYSIQYFTGNSNLIPQYVQYIVLGSLVACFAVVFIGYWVKRRR